MDTTRHNQQPDARDRDFASLRERLSRLSQASRRINESLDFDTVLQEVVDGARALTDSRYGVLTTLDGSSQPLDFVTSGLSAEEQHGLEDFLPEGLLVYQYLSALDKPLRVDDYQGHVSSLGLPDFSPVAIGPFLAAPVRHLGESVGTIVLAKDEPGPEFSDDDEETLVTFAAQAALVIANARRHREERRARAGLETLVETSPVGVVVFDVQNRRLASMNREARRILADLLETDGSWEQLLGFLTFRRSDGREVSLGDLTVYEALEDGETVRAEEIAIGLPDGRSVTALVNATPIHSEEGEVESFVVTLQDLSPLEDLERLRADFLGTVSHELRTPLTSISGAAATLLSQGAALDPAESRQFHRIIAEQAERMRGLLSDLLDATRLRTGTLPVSPEPSEPTVLVDEARSAFLAVGGGRSVTLDLAPDLPWVMVDRRRVLQVLGNLLSNAARHSPGDSTVRVSATHEDGMVSISVADQGRGIEPERLPHLFRGFSRVDAGDGGEPEAMGTGLGLSICKGIVEAHGGRIQAESDGPGLGSRFTFTLPVAEGMAAAGGSSGAAREPEERGRVLVVDDDPMTLRHVRDVLAGAGYTPLVAGDAEEALRLFAAGRPRLALLDLVLPGSDGIELMGRMRHIADTPVIFLSAHGREEVIARAFEAGAVDYVVKPFASAELVARVRNALRRRLAPQPAEPAGPFTLGDLSIDYDRRQVSMAGETVPLTPTEYDLLYELSVNAGRALTFDQLLWRVWGPEHKRDKRSVRAYVKRLRSKLGEDAVSPRYIFAEPRIGYRMGEPETPGEETVTE